MGREEGYIEFGGTVESLVYQNAESSYTVIRLAKADGEKVVVVGFLPAAAPGEELQVGGRWMNHPSYGEQFKAERVNRSLPTQAAGILSYLSSGIIRGVGPVTAERIVGRFGTDTFRVLEERPEELSSIRGITAKKAGEIAESFRYQTGMRRLIEWIGQSGLPLSAAPKLYRRYGTTAKERLRENPYLLTDEYYGVTFAAADRLALGMGWPGDAPERVEAAVRFELTHNLNNGHVFLPYGKLAAATEQLIGIDAERVEEAIVSLTEREEAVTEEIAGETACYLPGLYEAETYVAERILKMAGNGFSASRKTETLIASVEEAQGIQYAPEQRRAVQKAMECRVMLLTGGPGTGKTTCVRGIVALFDKMGLKTALTAPTGRAAKRMGELCGTEAQTIHRLLGTEYDSGTGDLRFTRNERDPLDADAVIVDETSMVDLLLMRALLGARGENARLILVGDPDQLPSVGAGDLFSDLIRSRQVETVYLTEIFRQARESAIVMNAHAVNRGEMPNLREKSGDFFFLSRPEPERVVETILELCRTRLPEKMGIDPGQIQVLTPTKRHETGTAALNRKLQAALNPAKPGRKEKIFGEYLFREGDRVMQIKNNYDIIWRKSDGSGMGTGIFNGDVGRIEGIDPRSETVTVLFDDRYAEYSGDMLGELEPAFAITVHKSQGSEYRAVIFAAMNHSPLLMSRGVLYTAITRARELLILVGDERAIARMTANNRQRKRYSGLRARLCMEGPPQSGSDHNN